MRHMHNKAVGEINGFKKESADYLIFLYFLCHYK